MVLGNNKDCGLSSKGTGIIDCVQTLGKPVGFWDLPSNFSIDVETGTVDRAAIESIIQAGTLKVFNDSVDFGENNEGDVTETFSSGIIVDVRDGLPAFDFTYIHGYGWHSIAYSNNGFGGNIALLFENGVVGFALSSDGTKVEGLKRGRLKTQPFKNNTGSEVAKTMISLQLTDSYQYNTRMFLINTENFGSNPNDINGAIDVALSVVGTPALGDTTIVVEASASLNSAIGVAGLQATDFQVSGQAVSATAYDATTKQYTLTVDALVAGDKRVSLGLATGEVAVAVAGALYCGSSAEFTV